MKKLKLITSLTALGTVACATPIVVTGCSSDKQDFTDWTFDGGDVPTSISLTVGTDQEVYANKFAAKYNGTAVTMSDITAEGYNEAYVTVISGNDASIKLHPVAAGDTDIKLVLKDAEGHQGSVTTKISVTATPPATKTISVTPVASTGNCEFNDSTSTLTITTVGTAASATLAVVSNADETFSIEGDAPTGMSIPTTPGNVLTMDTTYVPTATTGDSVKLKASDGTTRTITVKGPDAPVARTITATGTLGGVTDPQSGATLTGDITNTDSLVLTISGSALAAAPTWTLTGGTTPPVETTEYTITPDGSDNNKATFAIVDADAFEFGTLYTIEAKDGDTSLATFTFTTVDHTAATFTFDSTIQPITATPSAAISLGAAKFTNADGTAVTGMPDASWQESYDGVLGVTCTTKSGTPSTPLSLAKTDLDVTYNDTDSEWKISINSTKAPTIDASTFNGTYTITFTWTPVGATDPIDVTGSVDLIVNIS